MRVLGGLSEITGPAGYIPGHCFRPCSRPSCSRRKKKLHSRDTSVCSIKLVTLKGGGIRNINKKEKGVWFCLHLMDVEKSVSVLCCLKALAMLGIV